MPVGLGTMLPVIDQFSYYLSGDGLANRKETGETNSVRTLVSILVCLYTDNAIDIICHR